MASSGSFNTSAYDGAYLAFNWSVDSQDTVNNQTIISWSLKGAGINSGYWYMAGAFKVVVNGVIVYQSSNRIKLYTGTVVAQGKLAIPHDSNGNKTFSASAEAGIYYTAVNVRGSGSWDLPAIARKAYVTKAFNFTDTENPKFQYANPAGNNVSSLQACLSFDNSTADIAYRDIAKNGQSFTFNLTDGERNTIRQKVAGQSAKVYYIVKTVINGSTYTDSQPATCSIADSSPTFDCSYLDTKQDTVDITGDNKKIIQNNSDLVISLSNISVKKYATIKSVGVSLNGVSYSGSVSGTNASITIGKVDISGDIDAVVSVTDSRGFSTAKPLKINILPWQLPTASVSVTRQANYYSDCSIVVNADYAYLDDKNSVAIKYRIKKDGSDSWSDFVAIENHASASFEADNHFKWLVQIVISDRLGTTTYNVDLAKGVPIIYFDRKKQSVGINCFPKSEGNLEINGKTIFDMIYPVGTIYISASNVSPSVLFGGTWEQIQDRFLIGAGSSYQAGSVGGEATHTLTIDEMPRHNHEIDNLNASGNSTPYMTVQAQDKKGYGGNVQTMFAGGSQPHNNMPPYLAVYIWKRVG
nr:MAG TPA: baseplate wedge protein [Caudoviricetes sp.]